MSKLGDGPTLCLTYDSEVLCLAATEPSSGGSAAANTPNRGYQEE